MKYSRKYANRIKKKITMLTLVSIAIICLALAVIKTSKPENKLLETEKEVFTANEKVIDFSQNSYNKITNAKIVGGNSYFMVLAEDGKVYGWGQNNYGQLATGNNANQSTPTYMGIDNAIDIAAGSYFGVVVKTDGTVWTVGYNNIGQLGNGTTENSYEFVQVRTEDGYLNNIKAVGAGDDFAFAISNDNEVYAWGNNNYAQLGTGDTISTEVAVKTKFQNITQISAGEKHTVALDANGAVWTVGYNHYGQLGTSNTTNQTTPQKILASGAKEVATGRMHTVVLKEDGTVWATGYNGASGNSTSYYVLGVGGTGTNYRDSYFQENGSTYIVYKLRQMKVGNSSTNITGITHISANSEVTYAVGTTTEGMYTAGINNYGVLFNSTTSKYYYATKQQSDKIIKDMAVTRSGNTGAYIDDIGRIYTVGYSANGELGNETTSTSYGYIPYSISDYKLLVDSRTVSLKVGETKDIEVTLSKKINVIDEPKSASINFESLDESIATVNENKITAVAKGTTYIRISDTQNKMYGAVKVNVTDDGNVAFAKIFGGTGYFVALKSDGTVWTWGKNTSGELGLGDTKNREKPTKTNMTDVVDITAGDSFTVALKLDGTVWTTGLNNYGQLGDGTTESRTTFKKVEGASDIVAIAAEKSTMHLLKRDGTVWSCGYNGYGQIGDGTTDQSLTLKKATKVPNVMQISGGDNHLVMQCADGSVWAVGSNQYGQLGLSNTTNQSIPQKMLASGAKEIATGANYTMVLKRDGIVWATGYNGANNGTSYYIIPLGGSGTKYRDGTITSGGLTYYYIHSLKQIKATNASSYLTTGKHIVAAGNTTYVASTDGGMYTMGINTYGNLFSSNTSKYYYAKQYQTDKQIMAMGITRDGNTGAIADEDGVVYTVGLNSYGQLGNGTVETLTSPIIISNKKINVEKNIINFEQINQTEQINYTTTIDFNLLKNELTNTKCTYTSNDETIATVNENGMVTAQGIGTTYITLYNQENNLYATVKVNVNGEGNMVQPKVVGGNNHFVALKSDGTVWTWGLNNYGQLGLGDNENRTEPEKTNMKNVVDIAAGTSFTAILRKDGTVWTSGLNNYGQLGDGSKTNTETFHKVKLNDEGDYLQNIIQITAENDTLHALTADGYVYSWGRNLEGQFGVNSMENSNYPVRMQKVSNVAQISGGAYHLVILLADGSVWGVGSNKYGQLGLGNLVSQTLPQRMLGTGAKEIAAGANHTMILKTNGTVLGTGFNGNTTNGTAYCIIPSNGNTNTSRDGYITENGTSEYIYTLRQVRAENSSVNIADGKHITASGDVTYVSLNNGGMYTMGAYSYGQLFTSNTSRNYYANKVETTTQILAMATTRDGNTGIMADIDGMVYTVGLNNYGQLGNGTVETLTSKICISNKKINITKNVINFEEIGNTEQITYSTGMAFNLIQNEIPATECTYSSQDETIATVDANGMVTAQGIGTTYIILYNQENEMYGSVKVNVNGKENITQPKIVAGENHFVALKANGTVWTWGLNNAGQLGTGDETTRTTPGKAQYLSIDEDGIRTGKEITDAIDVAAGNNYTLVLRADGTVWATGLNNYGQLGIEGKERENLFTQVKGESGVGYLKNIVQITSEDETAHALTKDGYVYSWGRNLEGQFGVNSKENSSYPVRMQKISNVTQISGGSQHLIMLLADGSVWGVGNNKYGQLGIRNLISQSLPQKMIGTGVKEVAAGKNHTMILKTNGTVWGTGFNGNNAEGTSYYVIPLGASNQNCRDGSFSENNGTVSYLYALRQIKAINGSTDLTGGKHIVASGDVTYVVANDGGMYVMGSNSYGQLFTSNTAKNNYARKIKEGKNILAAIATRNGKTGIFADVEGTVYTVGANNYGQLGNGTTESLVEPICISEKKINVDKNIINFNKPEETETITYSTTMAFNLIKDEIPSLTCVFKSLDNEIATVDENGLVTAKGIGTTYIQLCNSDNLIYAAVKVNVNGEENITQPKIIGGESHFVALKANGTVWTWGLNNYGQLGLNNKVNVTEPTRVKYIKTGEAEEELSDVIDIAAGKYFTIILRKDGTVWGTGINNYGQLGNGTTENSNTFVQVKSADNGEYLRNIVQITAEDETVHALTEDGYVYSWGRNLEGQFGRNNTENSSYPVKMQKVTDIMQISGGSQHLAMLLADGSVWTVGSNKYGQLGIGNLNSQTLPQKMVGSGVKEIATGANHTMILKTDGTVWGTGYNGNGSQGTSYCVIPLGGSNTSYRDGYITENGGSSLYLYSIRQVKAINNSTNLTGAKHITASGNVTYVIANDGGMYTMGANNYGQLFASDTSRNYYARKVEEDKEILAMAITRDGRTGIISDIDGMVYTVGINNYGQMGLGDTVNLTTPMCISNVKMKVNSSVINYSNIGETGEKITYKLTAGFNLISENIAQGEVTFTSLDDTVATVDESGVVTATGRGTTYIKVYNKDTDTYAAVRVNVSSQEGIVYPKIVAGANHFVALKANGEVWTWGLNNNGQLGLGDQVTRTKPTNSNIYTLDNNEQINAIDVAAGSNYTLVLKADGTVWSAGRNDYGQLGDGTTDSHLDFVQVKDLKGEGYLQNVVQIAASNATSYALLEDGTVYSWGYNGNGQLGIGQIDTNAHTLPTRMSRISGIMQIAAGANHAIFVETRGTVWGVGYNEYGQLGTGNNTRNVSVPAQMKNSSGSGNLTGAKQASAGANHTIIALENGTAVAMGYNRNYQLAQGTTKVSYLPVIMTKTDGSPITQVKDVLASGNSSIISVYKNESNAGIYVAGNNNYGQLYTSNTANKSRLTLVQADKEIISMATTTNASYQTSAIVDNYGLVYTVGYNAHGEMGDDTIISSTKPECISEAYLECDKTRLLLTVNDSEQVKIATTLGFNLLYYKVENEELSYNSLDTSVATINNNGMVTGESFGTTKVEVGTNKLPNRIIVDVEVIEENDKAYPKIVNGSNFTVALKADGTVWTWGLNSNGQLGLGDSSNRYKPTKVDIENIVDISAGDTHVLLLDKDGYVYSFGTNGYGQLGDGTTQNKNTPIRIDGLEDIKQIVASTYSSMALNNKGQVYTWGYNGKGQLGDGTIDNNTIPTKIKLSGISNIAGFNQTSVAVTHDGDLYVWGYNGKGQLGLGDKVDKYLPTKVETVTKVLEAEVENNTILALTEDGEVWTSGANTYGNLGNNSTSDRYTFGKVLAVGGTGYLSNVKHIEAGNEYAIAVLADKTAVLWGNNANSQFGNNSTANQKIPVELKYANNDVVANILDVAAGANTTTIATRRRSSMGNRKK